MSQSRLDRRKFVSIGTVSIAGAAISVRAVLAQGDGTPSASPSASPEASPGASPVAAETNVTVEMVDIRFKPDEFTIPANTDVKVHLSNKGTLVHNFNIDDNNNDSDPDIHSGNTDPGDTSEVTLNLDAGEWYYYCNIAGHEEAGMTGTVHVQKG